MEIREGLKEVLSDETVEIFEENEQAFREITDMSNISTAAMLLQSADDEIAQTMLNQTAAVQEDEE